MAIDRIAKPAIPPTAAPSAGPSSSTTEPARSFEVGSASTSAAAPAGTSAVAAGALEQLRSGAISLDGYLDLKVHEATAHLSGALSPAALGTIRGALRERLAADPMLVDLVRSATGLVPGPVERDE
jgi:hypothetical protein